MFVAISVYQKPLEEVNQRSAEHAAWIVKHYEAGRFLASGRRVPPSGGVIIGRAESLEEFQAVLAQDPYQQHGIAKYDIVEFAPGPLPRRSAELEAFLSRPVREANDE
jgi:uncharacterized protein YciI